MIDTRALAQEVQDQLVAAVHRGQEQFRRGQDQMRKSQDQMRKTGEAMAVAIRSGNQLAKSIRPSIPSLPVPTVRIPSVNSAADRAKLREGAQELADQVIATQRQLADRALQVTGPLAEQVIATQRQLATRAMHAASPVVADRVARLTHAVGTLPGMRRLGLADGVATEEGAADSKTSATDFVGEVRKIRPTTTAREAVGVDETSADDFAEIREIRPATAAAKSSSPRAKVSKPRTPKASTTRKASPSKPRETGTTGTTKSARATRTTGTAKPRSSKAASTTRSAGTTRTTGTTKPRSSKAASTTRSAGTTRTTGATKPRGSKAAGTTRTARATKPRSTKN